MQFSPRWILLCTSLVWLIIAPAGRAADADAPEAGPGHIHVEMDSGSLTLEARDARLFDVLQAIGKLAGFETVLIDEDTGSTPISASFEDAPARDVVERLVRGTNRVVFYGRARNGAEAGDITAVWLLGSSGGPPGDAEDEIVVGAEFAHQDDGKRRSEAVLRLSNAVSLGLADKGGKDRALTRLRRMLEEDLDALVRARAAIALGALGNEEAVGSLESALLDDNATVRAQAISALGRIGGDRATAVLGNLLLYGSADPLERVMAAQALWKQDSEAARDYLRTGAYDTDEQVRLASTKPPPAPKKRPASETQGAEETQ